MDSSSSAKSASELLRRCFVLLLWATPVFGIAPAFWATPVSAQEEEAPVVEDKRPSETDRSGPTAEECVGYHRQAQLSQRAGKLLDAKHQLALCLDPGCSPILRTACSELTLNLEALIPSIVPAARGNDADLLEVTVREGETILARKTNGVPIRLDPGPHELTFLAEGMKPVHVQVILRTGERHRLLNVTLEPLEEKEPKKEPTAPPSPPPSESVSTNSKPPRTPWLGYTLVGSGAVMGATGVALSLAALVEYNAARGENGCDPNCPDSKAKSIATKAWVGNGLIAASIVALTIGTVDLAYTRAKKRKRVSEADFEASPHFSANLTLAPTAIFVRGRFP